MEMVAILAHWFTLRRLNWWKCEMNTRSFRDAEVYVAVCSPACCSGQQRKRDLTFLQYLLDHLICVVVQRSV